MLRCSNNINNGTQGIISSQEIACSTEKPTAGAEEMTDAATKGKEDMEALVSEVVAKLCRLQEIRIP